MLKQYSVVVAKHIMTLVEADQATQTIDLGSLVAQHLYYS
jgi:hypothetical protein